MYKQFVITHNHTGWRNITRTTLFHCKYSHNPSARMHEVWCTSAVLYPERNHFSLFFFVFRLFVYFSIFKFIFKIIFKFQSVAATHSETQNGGKGRVHKKYILLYICLIDKIGK